MPKLSKVTRLSEFMEVICNRPYPRNEHYTRHQNEIYTIYNEFKEILSSTKIDVKDKSNQQRENDERIAEFIRKHAVDLYDYIYRIKRIRENTKQDKVDQVYFYRGEIDLSGSDPLNSNPEHTTGCFRFKGRKYVVSGERDRKYFAEPVRKRRRKRAW